MAEQETNFSPEMTLAEHFQAMRLNGAKHLGLGDVRLTVAEQEELAHKHDAMREALEDVVSTASGYPQEVTKDCLLDLFGTLCRSLMMEPRRDA